MYNTTTFLNNKWTKIYFQLIEKRSQILLTKKSCYCEKHHIIPKSLGGSNNKDNIVVLTAREHFIAHLLLTKMVSNHKDFIKMNWALHKMCYGHSRNGTVPLRFKGTDYEWYKKRHSKFLSENHPLHRPGALEKHSINVKKTWDMNPDRKKKASEHFRQLWNNPEIREILTKKNKERAYLGGLASREKNALRIEYNNKIYIGWSDLQRETGVTKRLYKKYYLNGVDPTPRIGKNGPIPKIDRKELKND